MQTLRAIRLRIVCICLTTLIESQGCSHAIAPIAAPASQPASQVSEYVLIDAGAMAPANGFFISIEGARLELKTRDLQTLEFQLQLNEAKRLAADANLEREPALKEAHRNDWCVKWCLEVGIFSGLILGGFTGGILGKSLSH